MRYMKALFIPFLVFVSLAVLTACAGSASEFSSAAPESGASRGTTQQSDGFIGGTAGGDEGKAVFATPAPPSVPSADVSTGGLDAEVAAQQQAQQRIIVRTMDIAVIVGDVSGTVDQVAGVATSLGGWVVSASRRDVQSGFIAIRVPAGRLDEAIRTIRGFSQDVESEITTSIDVTDEYVDNTARLRNLEATRDALTALFARAEKVEDALTVQREITRIQSEIEALQGRIQLLEQTSAYSLINVNLRTRPMPMAVDAGSDQVSGLRQPVVFRATLEVPSGITDFVYTWDFGDGSVPVTGTRTAPTTDPGKRVTATVTHAYGDEWDSPYIAQIKITGTGEGGIVEGEDTLIVTVTRIPTIEVFMGENQVVEEGQEVKFLATMTRQDGLTNATYAWDFGDGTAPIKGDLEDGATSLSATHVYEHYRPQPFSVRLTIKADSVAGPVEVTVSNSVTVRPPEGWTIGSWDVGNTWKSAVRALSALGRGLATVGIWLAIFSPVWIVLGSLVWWRRNKELRRFRSKDPGRPELPGTEG